MAHVQWRQFAFFDRSSVTDSSDPSKTPEAFQSSNTTVFTSGRGHIILADILLKHREFNSKSFLAYDGGRVTHLKHLKQSNIIITVGESDQSNQPPVIKFWDFEKIDLTKNIDGGILAPPCTRTIKIQQGGMVHPVSTFAVLENLTQIAVGLANGTVILIRGDLQKERSTKQKVIHEGSEPITGLGFREQTKSTILFMVTTSSIMTYNTTASKPTTTTLDDQGCGLECAAIYQYDNTGRGPCFAYESPKTSLKWFKSTYLIITSPPLSSTVPSYRPGSSGTANINFTRQPGQQTSSSDLTKLTIFDTANKFVAYKDSFVGGIRGVVCEWGAIWIFGLDNKIYRLDEKDTPSKLEILFKQNLYVLAINLAHMQNYDDASIVEIFKKYGDHLYVKGDYDGAMEQYIRTIGKLEPSYVIRKFLDAQRIYNLTSYLQELHSRGLANADHTTLLLNCYTKLKDVSRLDEFIKNDADLTFDLETAITVCRQAGYFEHAVYLAERFEEHDLYLNIMLLDMHNYQAALAYIAKLGPSEADKNLQKYSKILLKHMPQQTTRILIRLCTGTLPPASSTSPPPLPLRPTSPTSSIVNNTTSALQALSLLPFSGGGTVEDSASAKTQVVTAGGKKSDKIAKHAFQSYAPPSAQIYMPSFVDHPDYLIQFLEEVYEKRTASAREKIMVSESASVKSYPAKEEIPPELSPQDAEEQKVLWTALLELYLMDERPINTSLDDSEDSEIQPSSADESSKQMDKEIARRRILRSKALALLKDKSVDYDANQALVLCHLKQFDDGVVYLYEKMEMYSDIIRFWMEKEETDKVIECARKFGPTDPSLYPLVLTYFSSSPETLEKSTSELLSVLDHIDAQDLLPPLQVVKALSRNDVASLALIKNYMGRKIEKERKDMERDSALIKSYREETERRREEIEDLQTSARVFQVTKCSSCGGMLELPTVHFLCRHSYHQRCLTENDKECPQCAVQHRMIAEMRRTQEANADKHDLFYAQLEDAEDGFSVIADYFSKNTMAFAKLIDYRNGLNTPGEINAHDSKSAAGVENPTMKRAFSRQHCQCQLMSPTTSTVLIDFHRLLNVRLDESAINTSGRAQASGPWTLWNNVSSAIEKYYSAYAVKKRNDRLSVQLATNDGLIPVNDDPSQDQNTIYFHNRLKSMHSENTASTKGRLQLALRTAVENIASDCSSNTPVVRANLVVVVLAKQDDEKMYEFSDDMTDQNAPRLDMRAVFYKLRSELSKSNLHLNVQVIKIFQDHIPGMKANSAKQILSNVSLSIANVSSRGDELATMIKSLAMSHFDLYDLTIYNIGGMQDTPKGASAKLLCAHENEHISDYISFVHLQLEYVQHVRKDGIDLPKVQCLHPLVVDNGVDDMNIRLFRLLSNNHTIILLHDRKNHEKSYHYTHAIIPYSNIAYLVCFDRSAEPEFEEARNAALELIEVKTEGASKLTAFDRRNILATNSFMETIIAPNLVDSLDDIKPLVPYSPNRYAVQNTSTISIEATDNYSTTTTENLERNTRWWLSFADVLDRVVTDNNSVTPVKYITKAFDLRSDLNGDILDIIGQELVQPGSSGNTFGDRLVPKFFDQLYAAESDGSHGTLFSKRLPNSTVRVLAKKIFTAIDLASRRFQHADDTASTICLQIRQAVGAYQNRINNKTTTEEAEMFAKDEANSVDAAWQQISKYQNMTLREKEEALQPDADVKLKSEPIPFANQLPLGITAARGRGRGGGPRGKPGPAINPMFRGRRGHDAPTEDPAIKPRYPDIKVAKPWLEPINPDPNAAELNRKRKDEQLGAHNSLLWTYWRSSEWQQLGDGASVQDGRIWVTDQKNGVRKRVKKEFDGRLDRGQLTRPNSADGTLADMLPL